jgi:hypothetical protein
MEDAFLSRYPQKGDSLFKEIVGGGYNISVDPYVFLSPLGDNWFQYIDGYKNAADILVDEILRNGSFRDFRVFPVIFLYRHFIELSLKLIIKYAYELYDTNKNYEETHYLDKLWKDCREIIEKGLPEDYTEILNSTENLINEFSKIDPTSFESRYPEKKKIKKKKKNQNYKIIEIYSHSIFTMEGIPEINLKNMKDLMEKINSFLGDMGDGISCQLQEKKDMESEYSSDY